MSISKTHSLRFAILIALILQCLSAHAQQPVAHVRAIASANSDKQEKISRATEKVKIRRQISGHWLNAAPKSALYWRDRVYLDKYMHVAIDINRSNQRGKFYLFPDSMQTREDTLQTGGQQAVYEIKQNPERLEQVDVYIAHGSMILDWAHGKLSVIALGFQTLITGTKVAFLIDSVRNVGFIYLEHGSLHFPDFPSVDVSKQELYRLDPGQAPVKLAPTPTQIADMQKFVNFGSKKLWSKFVPWWQKPVFYVPAAALTVAGVTWAIIHPDKVDGTVTIQIPQ